MFTSETSVIFRRIFPSAKIRWLVLVAFWSLVSLLSAVHWQLFSPPNDPWTWWGLVWIKHVVWFAWGFLATPLILWLGYRFRLNGDGWPVRFLILLMCSLTITTAYVFAYAWLLTINIQVPQLANYDQMLRFTLFHHSTYYFLAFWGTISLEQGLWLYRQWHDREMQASEIRAQLARAQLQALRTQIQPHLLFNVLNTVSATILEGDPSKAYDLMTKLGDLLRLTLDYGEKDVITLREEMELVESYLALASARFEDRLSVTIHLSTDTIEFLVPPFMLLTLVENTVKHVASATSGTVRLSITSVSTGQYLVLDTEDSPEKPFAPCVSGEGTGRGHRLIEERLRCLYRDSFQFRANQLAGGGMHVHLEIPIQRPPGRAQAS